MNVFMDQYDTGAVKMVRGNYYNFFKSTDTANPESTNLWIGGFRIHVFFTFSRIRIVFTFFSRIH